MGQCRLRSDHAEARTALDRLLAGQSGVAAALRAQLEAHFEFEERRLIPLLEERLPSGTGPLPVVLGEHAAIRRLLEHLSDDAPLFEREHLRALLLAHFEKEEELILPFARSHLTSEELVLLGCAGSCDGPHAGRV